MRLRHRLFSQLLRNQHPRRLLLYNQPPLPNQLLPHFLLEIRFSKELEQLFHLRPLLQKSRLGYVL